MQEDYVERVIDLVRSVPAGKVVTYGDVAKRLGEGGPRSVGAVMSRYGSDLPWWRVIRAGGLPPQCHEGEAEQRWRSEGTPTKGFGDGVRADLRSARWDFGDAAAASTRGLLHHVEVWVPEIERARREWGWLLTRLGYAPGEEWERVSIWELGPTYLVLEQSPDMLEGPHRRCAPGLNHLAFHGGSRADVDSLVADADANGWALMFADRHPFAGGPGHYAAFLESSDGYEVEIVAE